MVPQNWPWFRKIHFCHFQIDIIQTSLLQKVSEKKIVFTQSYGRKKICGFDHICEREREREKRSSVEELLALPDSSHVIVISFDCQLAFHNANGEKHSFKFHPFKFHNISTKPDVSKNQLGAKDGMSRKVRNLSPVIKNFFFPIARISDRMLSLRSWVEHVAASSQISMCFRLSGPGLGGLTQLKWWCLRHFTADVILWL